MNIGTFIACQNATNTARNTMFNNMIRKGGSSSSKGDSSSSKGDTSSSKTSNNIKTIIILFACFLFFAWCNFLAIYKLCQATKMDFFEYSFLGTIIFVLDVAYWFFVYCCFQISKD